MKEILGAISQHHPCIRNRSGTRGGECQFVWFISSDWSIGDYGTLFETSCPTVRMPPTREGSLSCLPNSKKQSYRSSFNERFRLATEGHSAKRRPTEGKRLGANRACREAVKATPQGPSCPAEIWAARCGCTSVDAGGRALFLRLHLSSTADRTCIYHPTCFFAGVGMGARRDV